MTSAAPRTMAHRLLDAMAGSAALRYGAEVVSELEHALQCADLAVAAAADEELVLAALLHDVGADLIQPWVPPRVAWCVRMHADAKRYLCATEPDYYGRLSPASRHTLTLQGGTMSAAEVARMKHEVWLDDAVALRRWDDQAKIAGKATSRLVDWEPLLRRYFGVAR